MPRTRPPYPEEFRDRIVELARNGRTPAELAEEFEPTEQTIRNWLKQADRDDGNRSDGPTTEEKEEIRELRKKLRQVQQERDILANRSPWGTAWFARETEDVPPKSSGSGDVSSPRRAPGRISYRRYVPCAGGFHQWLLRMAESISFPASPREFDAHRENQTDTRRVERHLRVTASPRSASGRRLRRTRPSPPVKTGLLA